MRLVSYDVVLEVLTPLHIGTGQELYPGADFVVEERPDGRWVRVIDVDAALLSMSPDDIAAIRDGRIAAAIGQRLRERHTRALLPVRDPGNLTRTRADGAQTAPTRRGAVRGPGNLTRTRALQRLPDGRPYIPGTTVKGSIRTALLLALADDGLLQQLPMPDTREKTAADPVEERTFSLDIGAKQFANRDLNRLIRVTDFVPVGDAPVAVVNMSAHRLGDLPGGKTAAAPIPIWCEAIEPGAKFRGAITIEVDSPVWNAMSQGQRERVQVLFTTWYEAGRRLLDAERTAWLSGPALVRGSVLAFLDAALERKEITVNLGWGGGWRSKTLGLRIPVDRLPEIARQYGLRRWQGLDFPRRFPVTRKVAYTQKGALPPGWVRVFRQRREEGAA